MGHVLLLSLMIVGAAGAQSDTGAAAAPLEVEQACSPVSQCSQCPQCSHCGCQCKPKKICCLKVGEGTYTGLDFDVKCQDYCIRGHSKCCGYRWVPDPPCGYHGAYKVPIWKAACGALKTRRYLVKVPKTDKVATYTCVVQTVCCRCGHTEVDKAATAEARANAIIPASFDEPIILDAGDPPPDPAANVDAEVPTKGQAQISTEISTEQTPQRRRLLE